MSVSAAVTARPPETLVMVAQNEGSAAHPWCRALAAADRPSPRDLSDAIHHLLMLHGRYPGMIDMAGTRSDRAAAVWLTEAAAAFAEERAYLNRLAVAAGPLPSTPGHAQAEAAVLAQCHAIEMLARSDRAGCAFGAAVALVLDWTAMRTVLDAAATRLGLPVTWSSLPDAREASLLDDNPAAARAIGFGARQVFIQHRQLWDLLEARALARAR
ncbi:MAG: hypothetical protein EOP59_06025 [Sphingomonadales bacterium]|nr:MAG: hypothetical protein EOP59_06025 [Sphingomonadales bacterium]